MLARFALLSMLMLAALVSSVIPSGYMPSQDQTWKLTICTADGVQEISVPSDGSDPHPEEQDGHAACVFSGLGMFALHSDGTALSSIHLAEHRQQVNWTYLEASAPAYRLPISPRAPPAL